jgi:2-methylisocitrate lyase-like PEP mutase family enzyme
MTTLRERLSPANILLAPGVYDALGALMAERAGFEAIYLSGAGIAYTRLGRPDIGLVDMSEVAATLARIRERVDLPIIADADTGYGNALNVQRTVVNFERAGANAIQLEDQTLPKRCGHLQGKVLVSTGEMVGKIKAALDARHSDDVLLIARTDAIAVEGFDAALERAERYAEAGADMLFVEAPHTREQLEAIGNRFDNRVHVMANMVEGGKTPVLSASELQQLGFSFVIFPSGLPRAVVRLMESYFATLNADGTTAGIRNVMLDFQGLQERLGTDEILTVGGQYDAANFD